MKAKWLRTALVIVIALLFSAPPCWAKAKGYCFVVGYSYKLKKLYASPVFMVKVRNKSYSETEYVADMELIQKMEGQFQDHLARSAREDPSQFTITCRGAYKNEAVARDQLSREIDEYARKKFSVIDLKGFQFNN